MRFFHQYILLLIFAYFSPMSFAQGNVNAKLAKQYIDNNNFEKAAELYKDLYNSYRSINYYQSLIKCYLELEEIENGLKLTKQFIKKNSKNASVLIDLGHFYKLSGQEKKAKNTFSDVFNLIKVNENLITSAATRFNKYLYYELAIQAYEIGLENPANNSYRYHIARIYGQLNNLTAMFENYIELIMINKAYLKNVKISLNRTISLDSNNQNNRLLKDILLMKLQESNNENVADLLIWLFIQEKNFYAAFQQEKSLDKRFNLNQKKIFKLASICRKNKAFEVAIDCYEYIASRGTNSNYYLDAQLSILKVKNELLSDSPYTNYESWKVLASNYLTTLNSLGKTSYTILLIRDLAQIQAFRLHDIEQASITINEALEISSASSEDLAKCKLIHGDILLLQNETWEAILRYSQVDKSYKHEILGHEAKYRRAKISYFQGDFDWAQAQLNVLKKSTSKLIANNAMELSLLIQDNLNLDTTTVTMGIFARADLLIYQNKLNQAYYTLDSIIIHYPNHSLIDEAIYRQFEIKIKQNNYQDAAELLEQIIQFYSFDILADDAIFQLAKLNQNYFKDTERASELYQDIITNHQDSFFLSESRKNYRKLRREEL